MKPPQRSHIDPIPPPSLVTATDEHHIIQRTSCTADDQSALPHGPFEEEMAGTPTVASLNAGNCNERPDPGMLATAAQFMDALRRLKNWSGAGFRRLEKRAENLGMVLPRSTITAALKRDVLPRETLVAALVRACGGGPDEADRWVTVRRRIAAGTTKHSLTPDAVVPLPAVIVHARNGRNRKVFAGIELSAQEDRTTCEGVNLTLQLPHQVAELTGHASQTEDSPATPSAPIVLIPIDGTAISDKAPAIRNGYGMHTFMIVYL